MTSEKSRRADHIAGRLLAAVSLLGASLGVTAAVAADNKSNQGTAQGMGWDVKTSKQYKVDSTQYKLNSKQIKLDSQSKKLPAVQSNQYK